MTDEGLRPVAWTAETVSGVRVGDWLYDTEDDAARAVRLDALGRGVVRALVYADSDYFTSGPGAPRSAQSVAGAREYVESGRAAKVRRPAMHEEVQPDGTSVWSEHDERLHPTRPKVTATNRPSILPRREWGTTADPFSG